MFWNPNGHDSKLSLAMKFLLFLITVTHVLCIENPCCIRGTSWQVPLSLVINVGILLSQWQVFSNIEEYAPGFIDSIIGMEVLTPPDLEEIFGLTGGVSYAWLLASCHFI